ncbi:MAG: hypothetical protein ACR2IV_04580 [Bryobacteraceae bacterium]
MIRRISFLFIGLAFVSHAFAREEYTRAFDKTLALRSGQRISLEHKLGDIVIRTHPQQEVVIHADIRVSASGTNQAKQFADRLEILIEPSASELSIRTRYPATPSSFFGRNVSYSVRYEITIPETAPLQVRNSFGAVSITGVKANSDITTSHGALEFHDGRGAQRLEDSFASIKVANNVGDVTVQASNGSVDVSDIAGAVSVRDRFASVTAARVSKGLTVTNSNGAVQVTDSGGTGKIRNSFGGVTVRSFHGDLIVNNANGKVEATNVQGPAELNTSFGGVGFSDIGGQLSIRTSNSSVNGEKVGGPVTIQTSFGSVTASDIQRGVRIQSNNGNISIAKTRGECNAKTSFGTVQATDIGGHLVVENSNGAVKASNTQGAHVITSFGPVILDRISGPIQVENQNGAVEATSSAHGGCQPIIIHTSFSTLRVRLNAGASYRVAARTSFGKIRTDFPLNVSRSISSDELNGTIGGGHCELRLTDTNGAIEILKP